MALKLYNETDIEAIADAIRGKNGSSDTYKVSEMADAIDDIPTGGGVDYLAGRLTNTLTSYESESVTIIKSNGFRDCSNLEHVYLPNVTKIEGSAFANCSKVTTSQDTLFFPSLLETGSDNAFRSCNKVKYFVAPSFNGYGPSCLCFSKLERMDIWHSKALNYSAWSGCSKLDTVILRGDSVSTLQNENVFSGTRFDNSDYVATLYVPQALISAYQAATNWSTILGRTNNQIKAIEGSVYETQYADGTPISS